jgi:hypothetical protein
MGFLAGSAPLKRAVVGDDGGLMRFLAALSTAEALGPDVRVRDGELVVEPDIAADDDAIKTPRLKSRC